MVNLKRYEAWFVTDRPHLYDEETLKTAHLQTTIQALCLSLIIPVHIVFKTVLTGPVEMYRLCQGINRADRCFGVTSRKPAFVP